MKIKLDPTAARLSGFAATAIWMANLASAGVSFTAHIHPEDFTLMKENPQFESRVEFISAA